MTDIVTVLLWHPIVSEEYWTRCHIRDVKCGDIVLSYSIGRRELVLVVRKILYAPEVEKSCLLLVEPHTDFHVYRTGPIFRVISPGINEIRKRRVEWMSSKMPFFLAWCFKKAVKYFP